MQFSFPYGEKTLDFEIDEKYHVDLVKASSDEPISNPQEKIKQAIAHPKSSKPLKNILLNRKEGKVCIVISDSTRPVPSKIIITPILEICEDIGILDEDIQILIATGLHRRTNSDELKKILGNEIIARYDIINHVAEDEDSLEYIGENTLKNPIYVNKFYLNASVKIITGYVEPHFFAGFSGGRKAIVPGIVGAETILHNHSPENIASPKSRFGILNGNPIYEDAQDTLKMKKVTPDFMINVCINPHHEITKVAAGGIQIHNELVQYQENLVFHEIKERYDVVITTNGGYPLDLNLYQAVKSMAIGEMAVKKRGTIISINECRDGVGQDKFNELINMGLMPEEMFEKVTSKQIHCTDAWEIQAMTRVMSHAEVYVISDMLESELGNIGLKYAPNVESSIKKCIEKYGESLSILVLPDGPMKIPIFR